MKTTPTDIDRVAARLFTPATGMRALMADLSFSDEWVTIARVSEGGTVDGWRPDGIFGHPGSWSVSPVLAEVVAFDTDDPATVGAMLAQVSESCADRPVTLADLSHLERSPDRRFVVSVGHGETMITACGPTRGAALVAAMKAVSK